MARTNNLTNFLTDVSNAIKQKTGDNTPIPASDFDTEILSIETGGNYQSKTLNVTQNGNYNLLPDQEFDAISNVNISVSVSPILQDKTITQNGSYTADQNYNGLGTVVVSVEDPEYATNLTLSQQILGGSIILPYIELDYLRTNNGYIALDETCYFGATSIILKYALLSNGAQNLVFFNRDNGSGSRVKYGFQTSSTNEILYRYGSTTDNSTNTTCYVNIPITVKLTPTNVTIDNIVKRTHTTVSDIITDSYYLPAYRSSNTDVHTSDIRIYQFQVLTNDTLIHNLIPVIKREDNLVYLYDTITETYYRSSRFIAGPEKI